MTQHYNCRFLPYLVALLAAANLTAQSSSSEKIPLSSLTFNGSAQYEFAIIQLTGSQDQAGSAFIPTPYTLGHQDAFEVRFGYNALQQGTPTADGLAFVAQNTYVGPRYLGLGGSGLGFFTLTGLPAIAATFDFYQNVLTGTTANTIAIATPDAVVLNSISPDVNVFGGGGSAGIRYVWIDYKNVTKVVDVYYSNTAVKPVTPTLSATLGQDLSSALGGQVYFGFTGGTGSFASIQRINYLAVDVIHN